MSRDRGTAERDRSRGRAHSFALGSGIRFVREFYPFPSFPGRKSVTVQFMGLGGDPVLCCYVHELYDGQRMRPEKLAAWPELRPAGVPG